jgi:hypothetical protein
MLSGMAQNPKRKPKLTDAERHKRFLETAREVDASDDPKDFDRAFKKIIKCSDAEPPKSAKRSRG